MNAITILLLGLLSAPFAAVAAWIVKATETNWTARQRVFNSAAIAPVVVGAGAACFAVTILMSSDERKFAGADNFLIQAATAMLAAFIAGMIVAYLVERLIRR